MLKKGNARWLLLLAANGILWCVLSLIGTGFAGPQGGKQPFANAVEQRGEMVRLLQSIDAQLKEQNALLRSGQVKVVIVEQKKKE